jgi:hypothetical protein
MTQSIEVVIPVHDPARPVARGIASVLDQRAALAARGVDLHVTVCCITLPRTACPARVSNRRRRRHLSQPFRRRGVTGRPRNYALSAAARPT